MPIRVTCQQCGKQFSAWDDLVGKPVSCPKCGASMVVPQRAQPSRPPSNSPTAATNHPSRPAGVGRRKADPKTSHPVTSRPARKRTDTRSADTAHEGFDDSEALPIVCPNCRHPMPPRDDLCDRCGYHKILEKVIDLEGVVRRDTSTGFERAVKKHLDSSATTESTLLWLKIVAGFVCLVLLMICLGPWFWVGAFLLAAAYAFFHYRQQNKGVKNEGQDPLSAAIWSGLLMLQRTVNWRQTAWPFTPLKALVIRDPSFGDEDLAELALDDVHALDLQGTRVSNSGLNHLIPLRDLRFLVLRDTEVTPEGVRRLQRKLAETWIWF